MSKIISLLFGILYITNVNAITHSKFNYKLLKAKDENKNIKNFVSFDYFIEFVENNYYKYDNNKFNTYYIYYFIEKNNKECLFYKKKYNNLNYTLINYYNITFINELNEINLNITKNYYCQIVKSNTFKDILSFLLIIIIIMIMFICGCCCENCIYVINKKNIY